MRTLVCSASATNEFKWATPEVANLISDGSIDSRCVEFNTTPLTEVYNSILDKHRKSYDRIIFVHDDLLIPAFGKLLTTIDKLQYDLVGLAGSKKLSTKATPLSWFTAGSPKLVGPNQRFGRVRHPVTDRSETAQLVESFYNSFVPDVTHTPVTAIDGIFICFNKKALESSLVFDTTFKNDFYDLDLCFSALLNEKLDIGVVVDNPIHYSYGSSILKTDYLKYEMMFRNKWQLN